MKKLSLFCSALILASFPYIAPAEPTHQYSEFPSGTVYTRHPAKAVIDTRRDHRYRTRIRQAAKDKVNFASQYTISTWGCGTGCEMGVAVDAITGKVVWLPMTAYISFLTDPNWADEPDENEENPEVFNFRIDSNMLYIKAYPMEGGEAESEGNNEHIYVMKEGYFELLKSYKTQ